MRIFVDAPRGQGNADLIQHSDRIVEGYTLAHAAVQFQRFGDLEPDREHRVQARHRFLENHRDLVAADLAHLLGRQGAQVLALEKNPPSRYGSRGARYQAKYGKRGHRFARTGFTDDTEGFAAAQMEAHPAHGVQRPRGRVGPNGEAADGEETRLGDGLVHGYASDIIRALKRP